MMMSTGGRSGPGLGSTGLNHQMSHSGANISRNSMLTAYSGTNTCHTESRLDCWDKNA